MQKNDGVKIVIFTEAGLEKGYGHLTRCTALYDSAVKFGIEARLVVDSDSDIGRIMGERVHEVLNWKENIEKYSLESQYVIVDSYFANEDVCADIVKRAKKVVFIDDYGRIDYPGGIVINPILRCPPNLYNGNSSATYLSGIEYVILRNAFDSCISRELNQDIREVFVSLGGADAAEATGAVIKALNKCEVSGCIINLVITKAYKNDADYFECLNFELGQKNVLIVHKDLSDGEMYELMKRCDFAISAAGQTINELVSVQLPFLCLRCAANQDNNIGALKELGIIKNSVDCISADRGNLINTLIAAINKTAEFEKRKEQLAAMQSLHIQGGSARILKELLT